MWTTHSGVILRMQRTEAEFDLLVDGIASAMIGEAVAWVLALELAGLDRGLILSKLLHGMRVELAGHDDELAVGEMSTPCGFLTSGMSGT